ncbi:GDP dissociation inhibitor [Schizothecium vesticola]|uniref:Rab proteins geranylgeranyltransferase n=1 Tax=Schizothecium vesticola TaxID=314040 RepID=A0AA40F183_9PEZI|nr:GDP dissociation inhibitor [Schizothecium vesticola]
MESLGDTLWDVVIYGTGLQQSLLALSLSRSGKKILHLDPNDYYGGPDAALSLQETEAWVEHISHPANPATGVFRSSSITKPDGATGLSFPRAYSLALAPQVIHARSTLLSQLVSSRAYRQVEFLAVGSFFVFNPPSTPDEKPSLARIPSTREDVFSEPTISMKAKRGLIKFLKFVLDYEGESQRDVWTPHADGQLTDFLQKQFNLDAQLQAYVVALTLSLDGKISTKDGLAIIYRHLTSMGLFGPGFAAVYPKWGGLSEIAQVACRAGAVGGAVYMLGTSIQKLETRESEIELHLSSGDVVKTQLLVRNDEITDDGSGVSRMVAVVRSTLKELFEPLVEGAPLPAVAVVAFPRGLVGDDGTPTNPVYLFAHSSDTGECPVGQCVLYLTTLRTSDSKKFLNKALNCFLESINEGQKPQSLYQLYYEQARGAVESRAEGLIHNLPDASLSLSFDDSTLEPMKAVWEKMLSDAPAEAEYMVFPDRDVGQDEEELYD